MTGHDRTGHEGAGPSLIRFLVALHPKWWRRQYGDEYSALLEAGPITAAVVLDVLRNAFRLHLNARPTLLRVLGALALSSAGEVIAVRGQLTDNILWIPSSPLKLLVLVAVLVPWILAVAGIRRARRERDSPIPLNSDSKSDV
jgi:hypothetical protein